MKPQIIYTAVIGLAIIMLTPSCKKFLDKKSDLSLATPVTVEDNQALLDRTTDINSAFARSGEASADCFYLTDDAYMALANEEDRRLYTWQPDHVATSQGLGNDWLSCYAVIYISNAVLDNIEHYHITGAENVKGQALVFRAARYLDAAQVWCLAYNKATAATDLGMPLRLDPDMNTPSKRSTLQQTYSQILSDLNQAIPLLPNSQLALTRPGKGAAYGLLARAYLYMGEYQPALDNCLRALSINSALMDYNTLDPAASYPIKYPNPEVILRTTMKTSPPITYNNIRITPELLSLYDENDLRKQVLFRKNAAGETIFKGSYTGGSAAMTGIITDELYLIAAECLVRTGHIDKGMEMLNQLLVTRWRTGTFTPIDAASQQEAINVILTERKKELLFRGARWGDIKRMNRDGAGITLQRNVMGKTYSLPPNDFRTAIAIPEDVIALGSLEQNKR